jgi:predicted PurR-regulated permease PerM
MAAGAYAASSSRALWVLAVLAGLAFVKLAATLLIPIVVGVLVSLALEPIVAWLIRRGLPRALAAALVMAMLLAGLGWGGYALRDRLASGLDALPDAARRLRGMVAATLESSGIEEASKAWSGEPPSSGGPAMPQGAGAAGQRLGETVLAGLGHVTVVVFLVYFLLQSGPALATRVTQLPRDADRRAVVATILRDVNGQVQRFLLVQAFAAAVVALATWLALTWLGASNALLWGLMAGAFNSIPYFGPVVVSGGLFLVGLVQDGGTTLAWRMAGVALAVTSLEGWLLTPMLMGRAERMNVLAVFLGLMLWTWLWGPWGTLLAVPMLAVVKSVADHVEAVHPLGRLMATTSHGQRRGQT